MKSYNNLASQSLPESHLKILLDVDHRLVFYKMSVRGWCFIRCQSQVGVL